MRRSEYANQEFIVKFGTLYSEKLDADILLFFFGYISRID